MMHFDTLTTSLCAALVMIIFLANFIQLMGIGYFLKFVFFGKPKLKELKAWPSVTVIKPCKSNDDQERINFRTFFEQQYEGSFELLFVVAKESDPVVPVVRSLLKEYQGKVDARIVYSVTRGIWPKTGSLYTGHEEAKGEMIIWSDSDVRVKNDYIAQMVCSLSEPGVSLVTTPQYDFGVNNFATAFKVIGNNADIATFVMLLDFLYPKSKCASFGHSIGFKKAELDSFGPDFWDKLFRAFSDDVFTPYYFNSKGKKVVFKNIYCPVFLSSKKLSQVIQQKLRWTWDQKTVVGNRFLYATGFLLYAQIPSLLLCLVTGFSSFSLSLFFSTALIRILASSLLEVFCLGSVSMSLRWFWTALFWDFSQLFFLTYGLVVKNKKQGSKKLVSYGKYFLKEVA